MPFLRASPRVYPRNLLWDVGPELILTDSGTVSLSATLPADAKKGGAFSVSATGAALPPGVSLSSAGVLSAAEGTPVQSITGVVFAYDEPA